MLRNVPATVRKKFPRLSRWLSRLAWAGANLGFGVGLLQAAAHEVGAPMPTAGLWSSVALLVVSVLLGVGSSIVFRVLGRESPVALTSESKTLHLEALDGRKTELSKRDIQSVLRNGGRLWIGQTDGTILDIQGLDEKQAKTIEDQFGRRAFSLVSGAPSRVGRGLMWMAAVTCFTGVATLLSDIPPDHAAPLAVYTGALFAGWIATFHRSGTLEVGADGIVVMGQFIPYQDLLQLTSEPGCLVVVRQDSSRHTYAVTLDPEHIRALDHSLRARMDAGFGAGEVYDRRPAESIAEWVKRLRHLFEARDFRHGMESTEVAENLLTSPKVPFRVRVGLATALAEIDPIKVRAAMDDMVDPRLVPLAEAAIEGDEALVRKLEALPSSSG